MGQRCLRLCNASLRWATVRCLGTGIWQWQRGTNAVAGEVAKTPSLHCNQILQSAPKPTLNLLNVPTDV